MVGAYEENLDPVDPLTLEAIKTDSSIVSVGRKSGTDLLAYYAASDCFVFPSYREGFPNTVLEAGAMGLPCIVTDINGSREIIKDGYNGLIVPSHDADAMYEAMKWMLDNPGKRESMASVSREHIAAHYEQGFVRKCLLDYYREILQQ
jgi:glycosyltransferase involved in cell wall biosynthesis